MKIKHHPPRRALALLLALVLCLSAMPVAFAGQEDPQLRLTFDTNLRWRDTQLDLCMGDWGAPILQGEDILMELKLPEACPLWLTHALTEVGAFPTSFSKYGICYKEHILKKEALFSA